MGQGHQRLFAVMSEKDALYAKADFSDADGERAAVLEGEFADLEGWNADYEAAELLSGLGITEDKHYSLMSDLGASEKVRVLGAQSGAYCQRLVQESGLVFAAPGGGFVEARRSHDFAGRGGQLVPGGGQQRSPVAQVGAQQQIGQRGRGSVFCAHTCRSKNAAVASATARAGAGSSAWGQG